MRWQSKLSGYITIASIGLAFLFSLWVLDSVLDTDGEPLPFSPHQWVVVDTLRMNVGLTVDGLSALMLVVVTGVSFLVQIYSQSYMAGDRGYSRYFAFMSLFTGSMLGVVLASNILMLFAFWELVGLSSYLLIGFWHERPAARAAATKAFIVTRLGDLGLLSAILLIWTQTGELDIPRIQELAVGGAIGSSIIVFFAGGIFAGAAGKSAQFPLHVWLPDAMEGPTPVSALIHAATMVAAGVYLVARFFPVFAMAEEAMTTVVTIGAITVIISALLAIVMTDIKRVLAYSTISQLGYMMLALGVFGFAAAIFHLFTHAFFKALLFLGAGSLNHATGTFDMRRMGGLARHMPVTFLATTAAGLALVGIFPFAGFWSKDEILASAWAERPLVFWVALIGVFLTAVYVGRMLFMTFGGEYKGGERSEHGEHAPGPHESPWVMILPMVVLAALSLTAGFVNLREGFDHILEGALPLGAVELQAEASFKWGIALGSVALGLSGLFVAWVIYSAKVITAESIRSALQPVHKLLERKYYLDWLYEEVILRRVILQGAVWGLDLWDRYVVDGVANGTAMLTRLSADRLRLAQTGQMQIYGVAIFLGVVATVLGILLVNP